MSKVVHHELNRLERRLLRLCAVAEESVLKAVRCCHDADKAMAEEVVGRDVTVDRQEVFIEEEALKLLALYHPVASDLRFIMAAIKINNDLERVGDLAVGIAKSVKQMGEIPAADLSADLDNMGDKAVALLRKSLDAFMKQDIALAREVSSMDEEVDRLNRAIIDKVTDAFGGHPASRETLVSVLLIARALERVADHATNIAEDVIYMLEGEIVRHRRKLAAQA
jgi:phosphate transport system protein